MDPARRRLPASPRALWLPDDAEHDPVPAILDAVPYRKGDGTAAGDAAWNR